MFSVCLAQATDAPAGQTLQPSSPAAAVNAHLPSWIRLSGELRAREEGFLGNRFEPGNDDMYLLQRIRLGVQIQPAPWLKFFTQGQDARVSFTDRVAPAPPHQDSADIRQAYVELGNTESYPIALRAGRQDLAFGEERLVGASNWGNIGRSFDAVRLGLHHGNFHVDAFASSVVVPRDHTFDRHIDGDNLHGLYGRIENVIPKAKVEPFLFWRLAPVALSEAGIRGKVDSKTIGVRFAGTLPRHFEYTMELAGQTGNWGSDPMRTFAGFWRLGREFTGVKWNPRVRLEVNHATGDKNPGDGRHGTFDVLYPTAHDKYGMADQVGWKNVEHIGLIAEFKPRPAITVQGKFHDWWLNSATDGLYSSGGALLVRDRTGAAGRHIGEEIDFQVLWAASRNVAFGGGIGHMFAGSFLQKTTPGRGFTFPYVSLTYGL
jgi:hypothetical protein